MPGLGFQPLGTTPLGVGYTPAIETLPSTAEGVRFIDSNGSPVVDEVNGGYLKADPVAMRVYFALRTTLESAAADPSLGVTWPKKIDARFDAHLTNSIRVGLSKLVKLNVIKIESISVVYPQPERYYVTVEYRNTLTQKIQQVSI